LQPARLATRLQAVKRKTQRDKGATAMSQFPHALATNAPTKAYYKLSEKQFNHIKTAMNALDAFVDMTCEGNGATPIYITTDGFHALMYCILWQLKAASEAEFCTG
jgi:hypothetical protein